MEKWQNKFRNTDKEKEHEYRIKLKTEREEDSPFMIREIFATLEVDCEVYELAISHEDYLSFSDSEEYLGVLSKGSLSHIGLHILNYVLEKYIRLKSDSYLEFRDKISTIRDFINEQSETNTVEIVEDISIFASKCTDYFGYAFLDFVLFLKYKDSEPEYSSKFFKKSMTNCFYFIPYDFRELDALYFGEFIIDFLKSGKHLFMV